MLVSTVFHGLHLIKQWKSIYVLSLVVKKLRSKNGLFPFQCQVDVSEVSEVELELCTAERMVFINTQATARMAMSDLCQDASANLRPS